SGSPSTGCDAARLDVWRLGRGLVAVDTPVSHRAESNDRSDGCLWQRRPEGAGLVPVGHFRRLSQTLHHGASRQATFLPALQRLLRLLLPRARLPARSRPNARGILDRQRRSHGRHGDGIVRRSGRCAPPESVGLPGTLGPEALYETSKPGGARSVYYERPSTRRRRRVLADAGSAGQGSAHSPIWFDRRLRGLRGPHGGHLLPHGRIGASAASSAGRASTSVAGWCTGLCPAAANEKTNQKKAKQRSYEINIQRHIEDI